MIRCLQRFSAVVVAAALLVVQAAPADAALGQDMELQGETNLIADALVLRPLGLMAVAIGSAMWAIGVAPFVALTRPTELDDSMDYLIMRPVRYTFADPLGHH